MSDNESTSLKALRHLGADTSTPPTTSGVPSLWDRAKNLGQFLHPKKADGLQEAVDNMHEERTEPAASTDIVEKLKKPGSRTTPIAKTKDREGLGDYLP